MRANPARHWWSVATTQQPRCAITSGMGLPGLHATAQPAFNLAGGAARLVVMASCPGNDQILIATVNSLFDLQLFLWNGSAFTDLGIIETSTHTDQPGAVEIVYEQQSGDASGDLDHMGGDA